jgi:lipopolysaccharide/colanic/teichoic acid biosynthesis glycosyltransferase
LRKNSDVPPDALVFLFIGRLTRDKGVQDLVRAFNAASEKMPNAYLWIVGPDEQGVTKEARQACSRYADRVRFFCGTMTPEQFMAAADVLSLPSYREGFGSVVIEAAAVGIPAIVSRIYGLTDAVEDGVTGLFHEVRNVEEIADRMVHIACDPELRKRLGENARRRAVKHFSKDALTSALMEFYSKLFRWHRLQQGGVGCKRAVDVVCAAVGLVAVSPVLAVVSLLIWATMGRPVLFRQQRPGRLGVPFTIHKLRTMTDQRGPSGELLDDRVRLTGFGKFLRRASLDELPQLWNVLMGDMSLVGPRPLLTEYLERYTPEQHRRHQVKPGMTGWAQVHGRQCIPFSRRLELDAWYVDHWSFWLDLRILVLTVTRMLGGTGVRSGQDTREVDDLGLHPAVRNREKAND